MTNSMDSLKWLGMMGREEGRKEEEESKGKEHFMYLYLLRPCLKGQREALGTQVPWPPPSILFASFNL